jgi:hypothetical protein
VRHPYRDVLATVLVGVSLVIYLAWAFGVNPLGAADVRPVTAAVMVLGIAASMAAVVPGFEELLHGSRPYLAVASAAGVVALGAGLWAFAWEEAAALTALMAMTIVMWAMSTLRHVGVHRPAPRLGHR